ncbi:MAG: hypothetical protein FD129_1766, partial [bacterium]
MMGRLWPEDPAGRWNTITGGAVFLLAFLVYAFCVTPTVPYWDSGEFIATSYILGIPHPPGTPLYVLIGRLFTMLPFGTIAVRVNLLSSVSSAVAVLFTYLIIVRLVKKNMPGEGRWWMALAGGVVGALFMAFGTTFWDNAIEAEVYGSASAIMCLCVWLALLWWDGQGDARNDRILWLILYILFLAIGIHLGTFLVFPCIYLLVTMVHWDRVKQRQFWGSIAVFVVATLIRFAVVATINDTDSRIVDLSFADPAIRQTAIPRRAPPGHQRRRPQQPEQPLAAVVPRPVQTPRGHLPESQVLVPADGNVPALLHLAIPPGRHPERKKLLDPHHGGPLRRLPERLPRQEVVRVDGHALPDHGTVSRLVPELPRGRGTRTRLLLRRQ